MSRRARIRACAECGKRATYITPRGLLCGQHAYRAIEVGEDWMPVALGEGQHLRRGRHEATTEAREEQSCPLLTDREYLASG